jgi:hypothetical protein
MGKGNWEVSGRIGSASVIKCTKCGAGLIMGMASDRYIPPAEMERMEAERDRILGLNNKGQK